MAAPNIAGFKVLAGPFTSIHNTQGYHVLTAPAGTPTPQMPADWEQWLAGVNVAGESVLVVRPRAQVRQVWFQDADANRFHGVELKDDAPELRDTWVKGAAQNIVGLKLTKRFKIERVWTSHAWRDVATEKYRGQGMFFQNCPQGGEITNCCSFLNGWQPGRPANRRSEYLHGLYAYWDVGPIDVSWSIFAMNAAAGMQFKNFGNVDACVIFDCGHGILNLTGPSKFRRVLIIDGHRHAGDLDAQNRPTSWTGCAGISNYGAADLDDFWVYGGPLQRQPDLVPIDDKSFTAHAFEGSRTYNPRPPTSKGDDTGNGKNEWGIPKGQPDPGAPQGARWTIGRNVGTNNWLGGDNGGSVPIPQNQLVAIPALSNQQYADIAGLIQSVTTSTNRDPKDVVKDIFRVARVPWA